MKGTKLGLIPPFPLPSFSLYLASTALSTVSGVKIFSLIVSYQKAKEEARWRPSLPCPHQHSKLFSQWYPWMGLLEFSYCGIVTKGYLHVQREGIQFRRSKYSSHKSLMIVSYKGWKWELGLWGGQKRAPG